MSTSQVWRGRISTGTSLIVILTACDSAPINLSRADVTFYGTWANDQAGSAVVMAGDVDGDVRSDLWIGIPGEDDSGEDAGAVVLAAGRVAGVGDLSTTNSTITGEAPRDQTGSGLAAQGDINGDGYFDLVVTSPRSDRSGTDAGCVYVFYGPIYGLINVAEADARITGAAAGDMAGASVSIGGDVNSDGKDDLLVGAPGHDGAGNNVGAAFLFYGPITGQRTVSEADAWLTGAGVGGEAGSAVAVVPDMNGDSFADLVIGAPSAGSPQAWGEVYLVLGPPAAGKSSLLYADVIWTGAAAGDRAGATVATAGDLDADGLGDLLVGAPAAYGKAATSGMVYVIRGEPSLSSGSLALTSTQFQGEAAGDGAGSALAPAGDLNADGLDDFLVGAPRHDSPMTDSGAAYVIYSPVGGIIDLGLAGIKLVGAGAGDSAGHAVGSAGDADLDGYPDIFVGAPGVDSEGMVDAGGTYILMAASLNPG